MEHEAYLHRKSFVYSHSSASTVTFGSDLKVSRLSAEVKVVDLRMNSCSSSNRHRNMRGMDVLYHPPLDGLACARWMAIFKLHKREDGRKEGRIRVTVCQRCKYQLT